MDLIDLRAALFNPGQHVKSDLKHCSMLLGYTVYKKVAKYALVSVSRLTIGAWAVIPTEDNGFGQGKCRVRSSEHRQDGVVGGFGTRSSVAFDARYDRRSRYAARQPVSIRYDMPQSEMICDQRQSSCRYENDSTQS